MPLRYKIEQINTLLRAQKVFETVRIKCQTTASREAAGRQAGNIAATVNGSGAASECNAFRPSTTTTWRCMAAGAPCNFTAPRAQFGAGALTRDTDLSLLLRSWHSFVPPSSTRRNFASQLASRKSRCRRVYKQSVHSIKYYAPAPNRHGPLSDDAV